nr:MAG: hypothetical protein [Locarnavirus sp.]
MNATKFFSIIPAPLVHFRALGRVHRELLRVVWAPSVRRLVRGSGFYPAFNQASILSFVNGGGVVRVPGLSIIEPKGFPYRCIGKGPRCLRREFTEAPRRVHRKTRKPLRRGKTRRITGWDALELPSPSYELQSGPVDFRYMSQVPTSLSPESEYVVKLIENSLTFLRLLSKAKDSEDYVLAIAVFAQCRSNKSLTDFLLKRWNELIGWTLQDGDPTLQGIRALRDITSKYETIKKLPVFTKVYRFLLYCVGSSLFEQMGITFDTKRFLSVEESVIKKEFHMGPDFIHCMLDTILYLTEVGYQCMVTGSIDPFFHHESTYEKWIQDGELLREQAQYISNPEPHGFTVFDFLSRLDDNIERGQSIVKFMAKNEPASAIVRRLLSELSAIRASCLTKRLAQQERKAPFAVLIHGGSSVGKSSFTKLLFYHYGKMMNLPVSDEYKYTRNAFDKYWTNFNSSQWCVQLDDIAYLHPNKASECDPSLVEMLQVVNNVPYVPTQADLADKGKTPVRARFVIATTNTENLNAEAYFACPLAVQRRLAYVITIEPKDEYRKDNGPMLDPLKVPPSVPGTYPDLWDITVKKIVPSASLGKASLHMGQTATAVLVQKFTDVHCFLEWFSLRAREADVVQSQALKCDEDMNAVHLCIHDRVFARCEICVAEAHAQASGVRVCSCEEEESCVVCGEEGVMYRPESSAYTQSDPFVLPAPPQYPNNIRGLQSGEANGRPDGDPAGNPVEQQGEIHDANPREVEVYHTEWTRRVEQRLDRLEDEADDIDDPVPGERYTMKWIWQAINRMAFPARIIAAWYFFILTCHKRFPKLDFFFGFLYGRWYFWVVLAKFMHYPECRFAALQVLGYNAYRRIRTPKVVLFAASITFAITVYRSYLMWKFFFPGSQEVDKESTEIQGEARSAGQSPEPAQDRIENVWYKDNFECTPFDLPCSSASRRSWTQDEFTKYVLRNCAAFSARVRSETGEVTEKLGKAVCVAGNVYMVNNHCIPWDTFELSLRFQSAKDGVTSNVTCLITPGQITRYAERDLAFIQVYSVPMKKDIRSMFAKASFEGRFDMEYIRRLQDGDISRKLVRAPVLDKDFTFSDESRDVYIRTPVWKGKVDTLTVTGDCGSLLGGVTPLGPVLLGIHVLGGTDSSCVALAVTEEFLMDLPFTMFNATTPTLQVGEYRQELTSLHKKSTFRYLSEGSAQVYGSFVGFRGKMKSRVVPTLMSSLAQREGYEINTGAPMMNSWIPWRTALVDLVNPVTHIDATLVNRCADTFLEEVLKGLKEEDLREVVVYDMATAINGMPGVAYVDKMPRNTSAGFPFRKSKKFFLTAVEAFGPFTHPVEVTPEIEEEMDRIIAGYKRGDLYHPVFTASLKDEPLPLNKVRAGKTRVFCGAPLPWSLVGRMYYLSLIRLIQKNRILFEAGPGTVAQSVEWEMIYNHVTKFGCDRICAGDYKSFDKRMPPVVILAAFRVMIGIMFAAGWTGADIRVAMGLGIDTAYPMVDFHGDLVQLYGSNPSGHILTVIVNCIANSLYCRYSYARASPTGTCDDFRQHVSLYTYGDDLIFGVSPSCSWFDHTVMQKHLEEIGIGFTMADKEAASVPFIHIDSATFLRRAWRFDPEIGHYVCPLEHNSINKMLTMCVESRTVGPQLHALAVIETALREYFWYGRGEFELRRAMFLRWIDELGLYPYLERELPTWNNLCADFQKYSLLVTGVGALPETNALTLATEDPVEVTPAGLAPPGSAGPASPYLVQHAFNNINDARSGACKSCAPVLEQGQRAASLEPQFTSAVPVIQESYLLQSGTSMVGDSSTPPEATSTSTVEFLDETPGSSWEVSTSSCTNLSDQQPQVELAQFLRRPVLIRTHVWNQTDTWSTSTKWNPWFLFFNSAPIRSKINNYSFINCKLKLKFVINASPFLSGAMAFTYCPLEALTGDSIIADGSGGELLPHSQRPKVWILPQTCQGGELTLPFLYHKNWLDITQAFDVNSMGTITPCLYANLASANGLTGQSVIVNVYAWAEDVKLHAPTTKLALQSDEFDYKPSQVASSVAQAASQLSRIPVIGPYMKATGTVASAFAKTAAAFGYTNVPNMDTPHYVKPVAFPHNSTCEVSVPMDRSAVDPKNEVTLDPRTVGLDGTDELSVSNFVMRETWLGNAILSSTDAVDALTLVSLVTPALAFQAGPNLPLQMTPMFYLGTQFAHWRGDIIFRFKFVCTRFHKGRVRITFDPTNNISISPPDYTTVFNEVVDIGAEQDIEVRVPYSQAITYLRTSTSTGLYNFQGQPLTPNSVIGNGSITMRVVNPLSGPAANTAIPVMVFVRAAENFEFAHPAGTRSSVLTASPYALQSAEIVYPVEPKRVVVGNKGTVGDPNRNHVHFGESIVSLRPLLHRLAFQYMVRVAGSDTSPMTFVSTAQSRRLKYGGFNTSAPFNANRVIGTGFAPYGFVSFGIHQMVSLMFVGERGSVTHSYNIQSGLLGRPANAQLSRWTSTISTGDYQRRVTMADTNESSAARDYLALMPDPQSGVALTDTEIQSGIVMNFPYYSPYNFQLVSPSTAYRGMAEDLSNIDNVRLSMFYERGPGVCKISVWSGYGPDYNFFFFKNVPSLYFYSTPSAPV